MVASARKTGVALGRTPFSGSGRFRRIRSKNPTPAGGHQDSYFLHLMSTISSCGHGETCPGEPSESCSRGRRCDQSGSHFFLPRHSDNRFWTIRGGWGVYCRPQDFEQANEEGGITPSRFRSRLIIFVRYRAIILVGRQSALFCEPANETLIQLYKSLITRSSGQRSTRNGSRYRCLCGFVTVTL